MLLIQQPRISPVMNVSCGTSQQVQMGRSKVRLLIGALVFKVSESLLMDKSLRPAS